MRLTDNNGTASRTTAAMLRRHTRAVCIQGEFFNRCLLFPRRIVQRFCCRNSFSQRRKAKKLSSRRRISSVNVLSFSAKYERKTTIVHSKRPFSGEVGDTSQIVLIPFDVIDLYITVLYINSVLYINTKKKTQI